MTVMFPQGWGLRINLTETLSGGQVYYPELLLALLPAAVNWAHWSPRVLDHTRAGWLPCASMFGGVTHPAEALVDVPEGSLFLVGNDMEELAVAAGNGSVKEAARRHADQLAVIRGWANANDRKWAWAGPQWNVNETNLNLLQDWLHEIRQHQGYARPHRLAIHLYGAWDTTSFWQIADGFDAWRDEHLPGCRVVVSEFSGWPGSSLELQQAVMAAGREYLEREHVDWVAWFSGYRFLNQAGRSWGTELAQVGDGGGVTLTALGAFWRSLA